MNALAQIALVFAAVKIIFDLLTWLSADKDKIFRKHLDKAWEKLNEYSFYDLAFLSCQRIIFRLKLSNPKVVFSSTAFFILLFFINYTAILISLSIMARDNPNFAFSDKPTIQITRALYKELGITGSQQIVLILFGTFLFSIFASLVSRRLLLNIKTISTLPKFLGVIGKQIFILLFGGILSFTFIFLSTRLYDWSGNTETQQYLVTQTYRMLNSYDQPLPAIVILNAIAAAFPSVLFLLLFAFFIMLKLTPGFVKKSVAFIIFRFTTDKKPVLSQVGFLFGGLAAFVTAIIKLME